MERLESVVDEECSGSGAGTMGCCEAGVTGDMAIVLDGSRGLVVTGCNGIATAWMTVKGRAGHSSYGTAVSAIDRFWVLCGSCWKWFTASALGRAWKPD